MGSMNQDLEIHAHICYWNYLCHHHKTHVPDFMTSKGLHVKLTVFALCILETLQGTVRELGMRFGGEASYNPFPVIAGVLVSC